MRKKKLKLRQRLLSDTISFTVYTIDSVLVPRLQPFAKINDISSIATVSLIVDIDEWIGNTFQGLGKVVANEDLRYPPSRDPSRRDQHWRR